jgi:hypothetical protein
MTYEKTMMVFIIKDWTSLKTERPVIAIDLAIVYSVFLSQTEYELFLLTKLALRCFLECV